MEISSKRSGWKLILGIAGAIIVLISLVYTNTVASRLASEEKKWVENWAYTHEIFSDYDEEDDDYCDYTLHQKIFASNTTIPVILTDERGEAVSGKNFGANLDEDPAFLQKELEKLKKRNAIPIEGEGYNVYYKESKLLRQLRFFPYIQLILFTAFVLFGYAGINAARKSEQNRVWVGLAKETAHQLGTPISAILAWIEYLRSMSIKEEGVEDVINELENDVNRLELVADRFSKIGSIPKLEKVDIVEELEKCKNYMQKRAPRQVNFKFPTQNGHPLHANINPPLFDWVIENLLRNALDAMTGKGDIKAEVNEDHHYIYIDVTDSGKGIPSNKYKTVFQPGYTTKKRGWGLGLSLAKRIIEQYHSGKIFVKHSVEGSGTTFTIQLPKH